jgi:hypothetical protein
MRRVCLSHEAPPEASAAEIPLALQALLAQCLQFSPAQRLTAAAMVEQLELLARDMVGDTFGYSYLRQDNDGCICGALELLTCDILKR